MLYVTDTETDYPTRTEKRIDVPRPLRLWYKMMARWPETSHVGPEETITEPQVK